MNTRITTIRRTQLQLFAAPQGLLAALPTCAGRDGANIAVVVAVGEDGSNAMLPMYILIVCRALLKVSNQQKTSAAGR